MCKKKEFEEKDRGHKKFLIHFIDLLIRRSITTHHLRSLTKFQTTAVATAITPMNRYQFSKKKKILHFWDSVQ